MVEVGMGSQVIFEFRRIGNSVKVSAIHVASNTEISIVGAAGAGEQALKAAALQKLRYVIEKNKAT
jgi:hypothetical protein